MAKSDYQYLAQWKRTMYNKEIGRASVDKTTNGDDDNISIEQPSKWSPLRLSRLSIYLQPVLQMRGA